MWLIQITQEKESLLLYPYKMYKGNCQAVSFFECLKKEQFIGFRYSQVNFRATSHLTSHLEITQTVGEITLLLITNYVVRHSRS